MCTPANGEQIPDVKIKPKAYVGAYYASMVGGVVESTDGDAEFPVIKMRLPSGQRIKIEVSRDGEGNGPGFLFGLPEPIKVDGGWVDGVA